MAVSATIDSKQMIIKVLFERYFAQKYYEEHKAEVDSKSPFAVTDQEPTSRIVDNPIVSGRGAPVQSHVVRGGFFGGIKGVTKSGGGWSLDTKVQFDSIYMCPVTHKEFLDKDMKLYQERWDSNIRNYAYEQTKNMIVSRNLRDDGVIVEVNNMRVLFKPHEIQDLAWHHKGGDELVRFIESHSI